MRSSSRFLLALALSASAGSAVASDRLAVDVAVDRTTVSADATRRQRESISAMPSVTVEYDDLGGVRSLEGDTGLFLSDPDSASMIVDHGRAALNVLAPALLAAGTETLSVNTVFSDRVGRRVVQYGQSIRGIPVKGGLALAIEAETGRIVSLGSLFLPDRGLPETARLDEAEARRVLGEALVGSRFADEGSVEVTGKPLLSYVKSQEDGKPALVWLVAASYTSSRAGRERREFWVNAVTGRVEGSEAVGATFINDSYSAGNQPLHPGLYPLGLTFSLDATAMAARQNVANTEWAWTQFTNIPTDIGPVNVVVNYGRPTAFYNFLGNQHWLSFGPGPAPLNEPMGSSLDVVAHEWGHGFFQRETAGTIQFSTEQMAMGEAFADFSSVVVANRYAAGLGAFEIAEDLTPTGRPLRSWSRPKDIDPMAGDWYPLRWISGDPHHNATIMGHAFYLLSQGGTHYHAGLHPVPTINVPALGFGRTGEIFYWTMRDPQLWGATSFIKVRQVSENVAQSLDPSGASRQAVSAAWDAVGVNYGCVAPPSISPTLYVSNFMCGGLHILDWDPVPGATTYFAEKVPAGYPWTLACPATDGPVNQCHQDNPTTVRIRLQACNGCGCGPFGVDALLQFYEVCL